MGASIDGSCRRESSSDATWKFIRSDKDGRGADPGEDHCCFTTSRKSGGVGIAVTGLAGSANIGSKVPGGTEADGWEAGEESWAVFTALKRSDLW